MAETAENALTRPMGARRPTIAFFVNETEGDYSQEICKGIIDAAEEHDVNLIFFPGWPINYNIGDMSNNNVIFEYVSSHPGGANVDALVICSLVLCAYISHHEFQAFVSRYKPLPMISIGVPIEGIPSVLINNRPGFKQLLNHLIHHHHKRKIAFIKGMEGHIDAEERFSVYREVLSENGLEYDPNLVAPGDFTHESVEFAMKTLDARNVFYDAIAVANDLMALSVMRALGERNIRVPDQVAVTGFDNGDMGKHFRPALTTVGQPFYKQSKKALEMALQLIRGNQPDSVMIDTELIIRESCGCLSETLRSFSVPSLDLQSSVSDRAGETLDRIIDRFIDENLGNINAQADKLRLIKSLIRCCFETFTQNELVPEDVDTLFHQVKALVDVLDLQVNDIFIIQKTMTSLKKWILLIAQDASPPTRAGDSAPTDAAGYVGSSTYEDSSTYVDGLTRNRLLTEDFFQKLRVFIMDMAIKMQRSRVISNKLEIYRLRKLLVDMVLKIHDYHQQLHSIIPNLRSMGIGCCYFYLYDQPVRYSRNEVWRKPSGVNLVIGYNDENWVLGEGGSAQECAKRLPWEKVISHEFLPRNKRYNLMLKPFFVDGEHLGLILIEFNMAHTHLFESLINEMSCALRLSLLFHEREQIDNRLQKVVQELEEYNRRLRDVSQTDDLTGLYNRRGFFNLATQGLDQARQQGKNGLLFFADMDGLKIINDQYGHDEGDIAIRAMGAIIIKTFSAFDIIARFGGDEFAILALDVDLGLLPEIKERLRKHSDEYNLQSGKPYQVSITIGVVPFDSAEDPRALVTLEHLLSQADQLLYEAKGRKK